MAARMVEPGPGGTDGSKAMRHRTNPLGLIVWTRREGTLGAVAVFNDSGGECRAQLLREMGSLTALSLQLLH